MYRILTTPPSAPAGKSMPTPSRRNAVLRATKPSSSAAAMEPSRTSPRPRCARKASGSDAIIIASVWPPLVATGTRRFAERPGAYTPSTSTTLCQSPCQGATANSSAGPMPASFTGSGGCGQAKDPRAMGAALVYFQGSLPRRAVGRPSLWNASHPWRRRSLKGRGLFTDCAA